MSRKAKYTIFVVGPESSGSTYLSKLINRYLGYDEWDGKNFNEAGTICHNSIPNNGEFPSLKEWISYKNPVFIWCVRDMTISEVSRFRRWGEREYKKDTHQAKIILSELKRTGLPLFLFSYEGLCAYKDIYLDYFYDWLDKYAKSKRLYPNDIKDGNNKYLPTKREPKPERYTSKHINGRIKNYRR